jgi:putative flippase GtrA
MVCSVPCVSVLSILPAMGRVRQVLLFGSAERPSIQVIRYGLVVGCGYLLAIALYSGELAVNIDPYPALGIAFVLNGLFNFALIRIWAFPPSGRTARSDLTRFAMVAAVSFVLNYASFAVLYSVIGLAATTAQRLAILIAAPVTFLLNRAWSFRSQ